MQLRFPFALPILRSFFLLQFSTFRIHNKFLTQIKKKQKKIILNVNEEENAESKSVTRGSAMNCLLVPRIARAH